MAKKASKKAAPKKVEPKKVEPKKVEAKKERTTFPPAKCHNCECVDIKCTGQYAIGCECCR